MTSEQIVNAPNLYINNFQISNNVATPNTKIDVGFGQCRDSTNVFDIYLNNSLTLDATHNGANGLDVASLETSTVYAIYVISDARGFNPTALLLSKNVVNLPIMPNGYGPLRLIGFIATDSSAHFLTATWVGSSSHRTITLNSAGTLLTAGDQTVSTLIPVGEYLPAIPSSMSINVLVRFVPAAAGNTVSIGTTGQGVLICAGQVAAVGNFIFGKILCKNRIINYINSAASCDTTIYLYGYDYNL